MTLAQILAIVIFLVMFGVITWGKVHRYIPALVGAVLVIIVVFLIIMKDAGPIRNVLNLGQLVETKFWLPGKEHIESRGINWQTIVFIAGMMVMVEGLAKVGFFRWMCLIVAKLVHYKVIPILVTFMLLSGFLSMFIDSITVMLFLASVTIEIARLLKFDPVPLIIAEIFASNTGGSATMSGDPPNIIIGTSLGYTFMDFVVNTGPIAWAGMLVTVFFCYFVFRKPLAASQQNNIGVSATTYPEPREAIANTGLFMLHTGIFVLVIVLLVTHAQTGISVALIGVIAAALTFLAANKDALHILKKIDWRTLLFFIGLFVCVGGLEETGVLKILAGRIGEVSGGSLTAVLVIILWVSAFASAIIDNIPFAATMVPVISELGQTMGLDLHPMAWALALGTDIGGNGTPIGASANVVGTAISEREGYPIGWGRYLKYAMPLMIMVIALCNLLLFVKY
jgi:Na+/H+ antiporter NhaD/arsenite permease-like protein